MVEPHDAIGAAVIFSLSDTARAACAAISIKVDAESRFGDWFGARSTVIESPALLPKGLISADFIGAYTYFGDLPTIMHVERIGRFCAIATNAMMGQWEHPPHFLSPHPVFQGALFETKNVKSFISRNHSRLGAARSKLLDVERGRFGKIVIGNDVWIGEGAFIRRGVTISDGAIIGARSVVVKDVPPYAVVAGVPARLIRYRFKDAVIERLQKVGWWRYDFRVLEGVDISDINQAVDVIESNIEAGRASLYTPPMVILDDANMVTLCRYDSESGSVIGLDEVVY